VISNGSVKKPNSTQAISKALIKQAIPRDVTVVPVSKAGMQCTCMITVPLGRAVVLEV